MKCRWESGKKYGYKENIYLPIDRENHFERYKNIPKINMDKTKYRYCPYCGKAIEKIY